MPDNNLVSDCCNKEYKNSPEPVQESKESGQELFYEQIKSI